MSQIPLKGKALIAQSGGCTAVINQSLVGAIDAARSSKAITHVWGACHAVEGMLEDDFVDLGRQSPKILAQIRTQPSAALGSSRYKLKPGDEMRVLDRLRQNKVRYLFMIGGNDTAETILRIARRAEHENYELRAVHIPKTIDNDLVETDHAPGYGSVARFAAITTQEAGLDTRAMARTDPVKLIELMGRNSGWIVAASALLKRTESDPPHLLLVPEVPFDGPKFLGQVEKALGKVGHCIVVLSETIRDRNGKRVGERREGVTADPFGHKYVDSAAAILSRLVEKHLKVRARYDKPGTIQRMAMAYASPVDQREAYQAGGHAVRWALKGVSQVMVGFRRAPGKKYGITYQPVALDKIPGREHYLPAQYLSDGPRLVTPAFHHYALPLLGPALPMWGTLQL